MQLNLIDCLVNNASQEHPPRRAVLSRSNQDIPCRRPSFLKRPKTKQKVFCGLNAGRSRSKARAISLVLLSFRAVLSKILKLKNQTLGNLLDEKLYALAGGLCAFAKVTQNEICKTGTCYTMTGSEWVISNRWFGAVRFPHNTLRHDRGLYRTASGKYWFTSRVL